MPGVTAEMVADGIGTGPIGYAAGYFGTYSASPLGLITGNQPRMVIDGSGNVVVGSTLSSGDLFDAEAPPNTEQASVFGQGSEGTTAFGGFGGAFNGGNSTSWKAAGAGLWAGGGYSLNVSGPGGDGIFAIAGTGATNGYAGNFAGDVAVSGALSKSGGSFKIDHPLDPANKYLYHSFVESPDMMNVYNGNITLDVNGEATVHLPDWFESLNRDFRYQLTPIGAPAALYVASEIADHSFSIAGGKQGMKVSWQVTGIRQDPWANAHRIPVEQDKPETERGLYIHPELYQAPKEKNIQWARHPDYLRRINERQSTVRVSKDRR